MTAYTQGDPRQKIQLCWNCNRPTERCEEDAYLCGDAEPCFHGEPTDQPWCRECYWDGHTDPVVLKMQQKGQHI